MNNENGSADRNPVQNNSAQKFWGMDENLFCMLMYFSVFANIIIPFAGVILPIVMWVTNKDQSALIDKHGKNILNFIISWTIYSIISSILIIIVIGMLGLIVLGIAGLVFAIIAGIKAYNGEYWEIPLCIRLIKQG